VTGGPDVRARKPRNRGQALSRCIQTAWPGCVVHLTLCLTLCLTACGQDTVARLKALRLDADPTRTLDQVLGAYPHFSRVSWSSYPPTPTPTTGSGQDRQGPKDLEMARATGIFDIDSLIGKQSGGRTFTASDKNALAQAGANLCFVLEYAFEKDKPEGRRTMMAMMIVTMDWERVARLQDEAIPAEIARGVAGEATVKAALDAADYCRSRPPAGPKGQ